jgi:5'(3')-deoxyribonucleotidase
MSNSPLSEALYRKNIFTPRVLIDVDDVCAQFRAAYVALANQYYQESAVNPKFWSVEDTHSAWDVESAMGLTPAEQAAIWQQVNTSSFAAQLEPVTGSVQAIKRIAKRYEVGFVTKPLKSSPTWTYDRKKWLKKHFGQLGENVVSTALKGWVDGDYLIEDRLPMAQQWVEQRLLRGHPRITPIGIIYAWPYNELPEVYHNLVRFSDWESILDYLGC